MPMRIRDVSLFSVHDVAYRLGIAEGTVRKYLREGRMVGRKHAGAWHVTEESFRAFLQSQGDDLRPEDVPQIVLQVPVPPDEADDDPPPERPGPRAGLTEDEWLVKEALRLKREARRLERLYIDPDLPPFD